MKLIKYFESKILLLESSNGLFYNHKDGYFYPLNNIYIDGKHKKFNDTSENQKYESVEDFGYVGIENLKQTKKIKYYSKEITTKTIDKKDGDKIYIEIEKILYPIKDDSFYKSSKEEKIEMNDDDFIKSSKEEKIEMNDDFIKYNKEKYYLTSKTINQAYVVRGKSSGSTEDFSSDMEPEEPTAKTPEPPAEETK